MSIFRNKKHGEIKMRKENCLVCWYRDKEHKSCGNATCPNFCLDVKDPDTFVCAWFEPDYIKERKKENDTN